jgi:hypothetical protein
MIARDINREVEAWQQASLRLRDALAGGAAATARARDKMQQALEVRDTAVNEPAPLLPPMPPPPDRELREFLAPVDGESPSQSITKLIQAVGLFATGIGGLAKGNARSGLAAITGALEGWRVGDTERANREFALWKARTDQMLKEYDLERTARLDKMSELNMSLDQRFRAYQIEAIQQGNEIAAANAEKQDIAQLIGWEQQQQVLASNVQVAMTKLLAAKAEHDERIAQRDKEHKATIEQRELDRATRDEMNRAMLDLRRSSQALQAMQIQAMVGQRQEATESRQAKEADSLRDDFSKQAGEFIKVRDAYARVLASAKNPTASGDLALIFNYMKMLDPGSVVRESEFATAARAGSFGDRVQAAVEGVSKGTRLSETMRGDFVDRSKKLFATALEQQESLETQFKAMAQRRNLDVERAVPDYVMGLRTGAQGAGAAGAALPTPPTPGMIPVKRKADGKVGWIAPGQFDAATYERAR